MPATAASESGAGRTADAPASVHSSSIASCTWPGSFEREVTTIASLRPSARRATYGSQRRDGPSHQCASSINSSSGRCAAALAVNQ